jgi:toxin ParE1/3/4
MSKAAILAKDATQELDAIAEYIAQDSLSAALRFFDAVDAARRRLADFPEIGTLLDWATGPVGGTRAWPVPGFENYLILYKQTRNNVIIGHVVHGSRDLRAILEK